MRDSIVRRIRAYIAANKSLVVVFVIVFSAIVVLQLNTPETFSGDSDSAVTLDEIARNDETPKEKGQTRAPAQAVEKGTSKKETPRRQSTSQTPSEQRPESPSREEIERAEREREAIIHRHISREYLADRGADIHWLDGISSALSEQTLPKDVKVLFEYNGMLFFETPPGQSPPLGESTVYQAVYDAKKKRAGVATGIVVIASDLNLAPETLSAIAGIKHSSSRRETGIHFFHLPAGGVTAAEEALKKLNSIDGVHKAYLATQFERYKAI